MMIDSEMSSHLNFLCKMLFKNTRTKSKHFVTLFSCRASKINRQNNKFTIILTALDISLTALICHKDMPFIFPHIFGAVWALVKVGY